MIVSVALPVLSAAIAALVSLIVVFLGRRSETLKQLHSVKTTAYVDFIRGVAGVAVLQKGSFESPELRRMEVESLMLVADSKARIAIYGSAQVVASMATFLRGGAVLDSPESMQRFDALCQEMRNDTTSRPGKVSDRDAHTLFFGTGS